MDKYRVFVFVQSHKDTDREVELEIACTMWSKVTINREGEGGCAMRDGSQVDGNTFKAKALKLAD